MAGLTSYAILLRGSSNPNAEALRRAFRVFRHLTDADAVRLAANAQGILMRHLAVDEAKALLQSLTGEGVKAALVHEDELRFLPASQTLHRIDLTEENLVIYDYVGHPTAVDWGEFSLVAAGAVPHLEIAAAPTPPIGTGLRALFGGRGRKSASPRSRLETERHFILELVVGRGWARYELVAQSFAFKPIVDRPAASLTENFVGLVRIITHRATAAVRNRAAQDIYEGTALIRGYPSRQALLDEMLWLLWNQKHQRSGGG